MKQYCILIFLSLTGLLQAKAQQRWNVQKFGDAEGFRLESVQSWCEDPSGLVWTGTSEGLYRFDGWDFKKYTFQDLDPKIAVELYVNAVISDPAGNIYFTSSEYGLRRILRRPEGFEIDTSWHFDLKGARVRNIDLAPDGSFWFYSQEWGVVKLDHQLKRQELPPVFQQKAMDMLLENGRIYLLTRDHLLEIDPLTGHTDTIFRDNDFFNLHRERATGWVWAVNEASGAIYGYNTRSKERRKLYESYLFAKSGASFNDLTSIATLPDGSVAIACAWGLFSWKPGNNYADRVSMELPNQLEVQTNLVSCMLLLRDNRLLLGTETGIYRYTSVRKAIHTFDCRRFNEDQSMIIRCMEEVGPDTFWLGTQGQGILMVTVDQGRLRLLGKAGQEISAYGVFNDLVKDEEGRVFSLFNILPGVFVHNRKGKLLQRDSGAFAAWSVYQPRKDDVWVGTNGHGLVHFSGGMLKSRYFFTGGQQEVYSLGHRQDCIWRIEPARGKPGLWLGTNFGICFFDTTSGKFTRYPDSGIPNSPVWGIMPVSETELLLPTNGSGLWKFDTKTGKAERISIVTQQNLFNIASDSAGNYWIVARNGVVYLKNDFSDYRFYDRQDGLLSNKLSFKGVKNISGNRILVFGENGFSYFNPEELLGPDQAISPVLFLSSLKAEDRPLGDFILGDDHEFWLNPSEKNISFTMAAMKEVSQASCRFYYMLEGADDNWRLADASRSGSYTNLAPGKYILHLRLSDGFHERNLRIRIVKAPYFYQTLWFKILLYAVPSFLLGLLLYLWWSRSRLERNVMRAEIRLLRAQMDPHFMFNSLNAIQDFIIRNNQKEASKYLARFSTLMRVILRNSRQVKISLEKELEFIRLYLEFEQLRFGEKFQYTIEVDPGIDQVFTEVPPMLVQPLIENSLKHGFGAGDTQPLHVNIVFRKTGSRQLLVEVTDDGVGLAPSSLLHDNPDSFGVQAIRNRLKLLEKSGFGATAFEMRDRKDKQGTIVSITMEEV